MLSCQQIMLHYNPEDYALCISDALQSFAVDCTSPLMQFSVVVAFPAFVGCC
jgi:hypothetical protein